MQIKNIHKNKYCFISWIFRFDNMRELWRSLLTMIHVCVFKLNICLLAVT